MVCYQQPFFIFLNVKYHYKQKVKFTDFMAGFGFLSGKFCTAGDKRNFSHFLIDECQILYSFLELCFCKIKIQQLNGVTEC